MTGKQWTGVAALLAVGAALGVYSAIPAKAGNGGTQIFTPARYALLQGELNVSMLQENPDVNGNDGSMQKAVFRIDTVTGEVWVLQLAIAAWNQPGVTSASWAPIADSGAIQPNQQPMQSMPPMIHNGMNEM